MDVISWKLDPVLDMVEGILVWSSGGMQQSCGTALGNFPKATLVDVEGRGLQSSRSKEVSF